MQDAVQFDLRTSKGLLSDVFNQELKLLSQSRLKGVCNAIEELSRFKRFSIFVMERLPFFSSVSVRNRGKRGRIYPTCVLHFN